MSEEVKILEPLWSVTQVSKFLNVCRKTVYRWLAQGRVFDSSKIIRLAGKGRVSIYRIPRSEVTKAVGVIQSNLKADAEAKAEPMAQAEIE